MWVNEVGNHIPEVPKGTSCFFSCVGPRVSGATPPSP
jgi:hypothetical protein